MMKLPWVSIVCVLALSAFSPIYTAHDDQKKTDDEFTNIYGQAQSSQFKVVASTPNLTDLKDGEVVIFSTGAVKLMFRNGQDIYAVTVSCVTIRR